MEGDGCTGWFDGAWRVCCDWHDLAYESGVDKLDADTALGWCVAATGHPIMGFIMFVGVSLFGWIFYKKNKRDS